MCPFCILGISELSWVNVKFWFIFKRLFDEELYGIVVTMILTTVLEVCKEIIKLIVSLVNQESGNLVEFSSLDSLFNSNTYNSILNIILLTLIIWGVTGLSKMFEKNNVGNMKKIHTSAFFIIFVISIIWYIFKDLFVLSNCIMIITGVLSALLFFVILSYFAISIGKKYNVNKFQSDHRIA